VASYTSPPARERKRVKYREKEKEGEIQREREKYRGRERKRKRVKYRGREGEREILRQSLDRTQSTVQSAVTVLGVLDTHTHTQRGQYNGCVLHRGL
jgi:hypothetical protein